MTEQKSVHLMVDLETLDTAPTAHVLSAAVVPFNPLTGEVTSLVFDSADVTRLFDQASIQKRDIVFGLDWQTGATTSASTLRWWNRNNHDYLYKLCSATPEQGLLFGNFVELFNQAMQQLVQEEDVEVCVWCTGSFDLDILKNASERYSIKWEMPYWAYKDVRVCRQIAKDLNLILDNEEATHNAYEDCLRQIKYVSAVYGAINKQRTI